MTPTAPPATAVLKNKTGVQLLSLDTQRGQGGYGQRCAAPSRCQRRRILFGDLIVGAGDPSEITLPHLLLRFDPSENPAKGQFVK